MKPVELVTRALEASTIAGEIVLDPFAGSSTTIIACHLLGRVARAIELDPRYAQVSLERFEAFTGIKPERIG